ncbi:MAG: efflux RND transporter periplasmic adaptor subunit, partial [Phycisphaerae bacterium]
EADATSELEVRDYQTARKRARAILEMRRQELAEASAGLKRFKEDLKKTIITSPITGIISRLNAKQGEVVVTGTMNNPGTVIMSISDLSKMQVRARVDEVDVPLVKPDQKCRVYLQSDPDAPVPARVVRVAAKGLKQVGRDVVTFEALLEVLSDDERIKPGMTANVEIEVAKQGDAITVPIEAVVHRLRKDLPEKVVTAFDEKQSTLDISERAKQGQYIKVLYVKDDEKAHVRLIESGIADTRRVEIRDGVSLDETVIVGPYRSLDQLKDGKKVALSEEDKKKEASEESSEDEDEAVTKSDEDTDDGQDAKGEEDKQSLAASGSP